MRNRLRAKGRHLRHTIATRTMPLLRETAREFTDDNVLMLGAAMAYYMLFSLFPLLLVILGLVGIFLGHEDSIIRVALREMPQRRRLTEIAEQLNVSVDEEVLNFLSRALSEDIAFQIETTLQRLNESWQGVGLIGFIILLFSASGVFSALYHSVQVIWGLEDKEPPVPGLLGVVLMFALKRLFAFGLVIGCAVLLLVAMLTSVAVSVVSTLTSAVLGSWLLWRVIQIAVTITLLTVVFLLLFKYLPNTYVAWRDVWLGALLTAVLFTLLLNISSYIITIIDYQAYGAVGSVMAVLLWIFLSSLALFLGVEFTQVYSHLYGSHSLRSEETLALRQLSTTVQARLAEDVLNE